MARRLLAIVIAAVLQQVVGLQGAVSISRATIVSALEAETQATTGALFESLASLLETSDAAEFFDINPERPTLQEARAFGAGLLQLLVSNDSALLEANDTALLAAKDIELLDANDTELIEANGTARLEVNGTEETAAACPRPCAGCPGDSVVVFDGIVPPCSQRCTPCGAIKRAADRAAVPLQKDIDALERRLHALKLQRYYRQLRRTIKAQRTDAETDQLAKRLSTAKRSLVREQSDLVHALDRAHIAELRAKDAQLQRKIKLAEARAYRQGFKARSKLVGNLAPALRSGIVRNVLTKVHAKALKKIKAERALAAYRAGLAVGKLLAGTKEGRELSRPIGIPFDVNKALRKLAKKGL